MESAPEANVVVLGAGYAGVRVAHELARRSKGQLPVTIVDRQPIHVVKTELYEIGRLAEEGASVGRWALPIEKVVGRRGVTYREGTVSAIDLPGRRVLLGEQELPFRALAICLGNVPAYYGVAGAKERMFDVYGLAGAMRLAAAMKKAELDSVQAGPGARPRVAVVGGGSTGTEVAAEIATADWRRIADPGARPPQVTLVCGALPFLAGLDPRIIEHARRLLFDAGVVMDEGRNVRSVEPGRLLLEDGAGLDFDIGVWAAGVQAPALLEGLPIPRARGGRLVVEPTLELPGFPGVFAIGDVAEVRDPRTGAAAPATAQAAIAEAVAGAENLLRRLDGRPLKPFVFRERGQIVSVGRGKASGQVSRVTIWGSPAALLKGFLEESYRVATEHGARVP